MKKYSIILLLFLAFACTDDETPFVALKNAQDSYYPDEIFNENNLKIYGRWSHTKITCGWSGDQEPDFKHLEIVKYGMYSLSSYSKILEYGKIQIVEQDDTSLIVTFVKKGGDENFFNELTYGITTDGNTLQFWDPIIDGCNRKFKRFE